MASSWSDNTRLDNQCKLAVPHSGRAFGVLNSFSEDNRTLFESVCNFRAQYNQELTDPALSRTGSRRAWAVSVVAMTRLKSHFNMLISVWMLI